MPNTLKIQEPTQWHSFRVPHYPVAHMVQGKPTSHIVWSFTLVNCTINSTDRFSLHPETLFWLCKTMGEIQAPHKSHKTKELVSQHCFSLCFGSKSDQSSGSDFNLQILLQWSRYFQCQGGKKKAKYCTKNIARRNQICHMTFSSPKLKVHSLSNTRRNSHKDRKALTCPRTDADTKYAPAVSQKVHTDRHVRAQ